MSTITNEVKAIDAIAECARGEGFKEDDVKRLAKFFKSRSMTFSPVSIDAGGGVVPNYWVGFFVHPNPPRDDPEAVKVHSIKFSQSVGTFGKDANNRHQIGSVFTVPMRRVQSAATPLVKSTLDFRSPAAGPKLVITTQLSGCTFAIGVAGNAYFMSHAQAASGATGVDLARAIHGRAQKFEGPETPTSTFLIHPGNTIDARSGYGYGDPLKQIKANVMGLVVKRSNSLGTLIARSAVISYSLSFIVVIINVERVVEKVVVVTHKDSAWKVKEV